jgi:hypothetical protein
MSVEHWWNDGDGKSEVIGKNISSASFCPHQIPHGLAGAELATWSVWDFWWMTWHRDRFCFSPSTSVFPRQCDSVSVRLPPMIARLQYNTIVIISCHVSYAKCSSEYFTAVSWLPAPNFTALLDHICRLVGLHGPGYRTDIDYGGKRRAS